ncbi:MAG: UDP-glucose 4-epimerase GalE [Crocinitomicaceae bacterium]|nr:UDP-glucose 4-epimerase GalE [Crocinitomicaceae bacterium]
MKSILVTGGAGFIGSHTVVSLINSGYTPIIVDDFRNANKTVVQGLKKLVEQDLLIYQVDVCDKSKMNEIFEKHVFEGVIHFAAYKAVGESVDFPLKYYHNNLNSLMVVLECMKKHAVDKLVFSSSCTVYGEPKDLKEVDEQTPKVQANSPYGNTKCISEEIIQDYHAAWPMLKAVNLRYFNPVGAHSSALIGEYPIGKPNNLLPYVTQTAIGKLEELTVFGNDYPTKDGTCIRDYIHVMDLANAHVKAISFLEKQESSCCEVINVGTGKGTSVLELITLFESKTGQKLNWSFGPRRSGDVTEIYANVSKAKKILSWEASYSIADALIHAWEWEKKINSK